MITSTQVSHEDDTADRKVRITNYVTYNGFPDGFKIIFQDNLSVHDLKYIFLMKPNCYIGIQIKHI